MNVEPPIRTPTVREGLWTIPHVRLNGARPLYGRGQVERPLPYGRGAACWPLPYGRGSECGSLPYGRGSVCRPLPLGRADGCGPLPYGRGSELGCVSLRRVLDDSDFIVGETVEFVNKLVDSPIRGVDLTLNKFAPVGILLGGEGLVEGLHGCDEGGEVL